MYEKLNKLKTQNIIAIIVMIACICLAFVNKNLQEKFYDMALVAVIAWLFKEMSKKSE